MSEVPRCLSLSKAKRGASTSSATEEFEVQSHVVTTANRQAVECEARNPCIHNHDDIKSAEGTTEVLFCRAFSTLIYWISFCKHSALRASSPAYCLSLLTELFFLLRAMSLELWAKLLTTHSSRLVA